MMKKIIPIILFTALSALTLNAQQELQLSQYMFNQLLTNPAYSGTHSYGSASIIHRSQWVSFDNAPTSQVASLETPIGEKIGLGLLVTNDSHGIIKELSFMGNVGYKFNLTSTTKLSLAVRLGVSSYSADFGEIDVWDTDDPIYSSSNISGAFIPKFGAGAYLYDEKWYVSLGIPTITAPTDDKLILTSTNAKYFEQHYYAGAGYVFKLSPLIDLRPSVLLKYQNAAPAEVDINANFLINKKLWLGLGYRTGDALIGMVEYNISTRLRGGYAYDFTTTDIGNYSNGSHEIMIAFDFGEDILVKKTSPRYF
ncbi:MAG: type IX secretion system membrane protein PorP/SprF [Flavobacteriales bacterium]|jgi:type IX secretion system PorP/SprF family membrane protein|tara:strand:+ start:2080 stop:3009 length:930 start_codon:yes stop_codon:yes gene_type:complete